MKYSLQKHIVSNNFLFIHIITLSLSCFSISYGQEEYYPANNFYEEVKCDSSIRYSSGQFACDTLIHYANKQSYSVLSAHLESFRLYTFPSRPRSFPDIRYFTISHSWEVNRSFNVGINYGIARSSIYFKEDMVFGYLTRALFAFNFTKLFLKKNKVQPVFSLMSGAILNKHSYLEQIKYEQFTVLNKPKKTKSENLLLKASIGINYNFQHHYATIRYALRPQASLIEIGYGYRFLKRSQNKFSKKKSSK